MGVAVEGAGGGARLKSDFDFLQEGRRKVLVLLDQVDFADKAVPPLEPLEFPHLAAIEQMVQTYDTKVGEERKRGRGRVCVCVCSLKSTRATSTYIGHCLLMDY